MSEIVTILPMEDAPHDGTVIDALFDGEWMQVFWSERADDMSPYGVEGWADRTDRMYISDLEGWKYPDDYDMVDEYAEREWLHKEDQEVKAAERREQNRINRAAAAKNRADLEKRYQSMTGEDVSGQNIKMTELRKMYAVESSKRALEGIAEIMKGFGF
jgi:hypothetical protein